MIEIRPRDSWTNRAAKSITRRAWSAIDEFMVHHSTGATLGADLSDDWLRNIQNQHMDKNGWADAGYNYAVDHYGVIWEIRGALVVGAHCPNHNTRSIGVVYLGDGRFEFSSAAKKAIRQLFEWAKQQKHMSEKVHSDFRATACPGDLPRNWVRAGMPLDDVPTPTPPPPPPPAPVDHEKERIRQLQGHIGTATDGIWGPNTEAACTANMLGWSDYVRKLGYRGPLPGNLKHSLVAWVQTQVNRKCGMGLKVDGWTGPATNHGIVHCLKQQDGLCGPKGFREACR